MATVAARVFLEQLVCPNGPHATDRQTETEADSRQQFSEISRFENIGFTARVEIGLEPGDLDCDSISDISVSALCWILECESWK